MQHLLLAGLSALALVPLAGAANDLQPPVRFEADGAPIDMGKCVAHSGPNLVDVDQDGTLELVVGDFVGHVHVHRNTGTRQDPVWSPAQKLEANGKVVKIPNW